MLNRPFDGYPTSWGNIRASVFPHNGPDDYTPMTPVVGVVPVAGGDIVQCVEAGYKYFDRVGDGQSDDGVWTVQAVPVSISAIVGGPSQEYALRWISNITGMVGGEAQTAGAEAADHTDLSAFTVRLLAVGPK